jgi:predicted  nucleic acid-binding Zn-ribbon protein
MKKEKVVAKLHKQINKASAKIDELRLKTYLAKADAKISIDERIEGLESQRNQLRDEIHDLHYNTSSAWKDLAEGCKKSWGELKGSLRKASKEFKS